MKSLRKSLNGNKDSSRLQISTPLPLPPVSKPPSAIQPPEKVIRARVSHRSQVVGELSFQQGDFFYVVDSEADQGLWYGAHNPITGARGLVPRNMFEEFNKNTFSRISQFNFQAPAPSPRSTSSIMSQKSQVFYAIVQHDFDAERPDELGAKRGDAITVVAQSNREWLVAKPIGYLGRPGLIPASFVEIHDPTTGKAITDVEGLMDRGELPKVEDWKKAMLNYKQSSIPLGVLEPTGKGSVANSPYAPQATLHEENSPNHLSYSIIESSHPPGFKLLPDGLLLEAKVVSFHDEMDEYWFRIDAIYQPYGKSGDSQLPSAKKLVLFRAYNDFYDFQVSLLDAFPRESGRDPPHPRILPYMPGPAEDVTPELTVQRKEELDAYVHGLCNLTNCGFRYVLEHLIVREFLSLKPGDLQEEVEPYTQKLNALLEVEASTLHDERTVVDEGFDQDIRNRMGGLCVGEERSAGADYDDKRHTQSPVSSLGDGERRSHSRNEYQPPMENRERKLGYSQAHERTSSSTSFNSRSHSPYLNRSNSPQPSRNSNYPPSQQRYDVGYHPNASTPSASSFRSSQGTSTRARSHSNATSNLTNPPISAANPQTAFVKIKVFGRVVDDLIAIRVHPQVTYSELVKKVQARLDCGDTLTLGYRGSSTETFVKLEGDDDLRKWMEGTDKHVLYAD